MGEGKRPGGLTALSVINFIFAGLESLSVLSVALYIAILSTPQGSAMLKKSSPEIYESLVKVGQSFLILLAGISAVSSVLLLISGIGFLKQKKMLGRLLGNLAALVSVGSAILSAAMLPPGRTGGGFNLIFLLNIIYPALTLILLNTAFKEDFIN
jgi:hypothetical protein